MNVVSVRTVVNRTTWKKKTMRVIQTQQGVCERATPIQAEISVFLFMRLEVYNQTQVMFTPSTNWTALKEDAETFCWATNCP